MSQATAPRGGSYLLDETVITLAEAARRADTHVSVVYRWIHGGLRGGIKLEACLRGSRWVTSAEGLNRFFDRLTAARRGEPVDAGGVSPPRARTTSERRKSVAAADKLAEALGA